MFHILFFTQRREIKLKVPLGVLKCVLRLKVNRTGETTHGDWKPSLAVWMIYSVIDDITLPSAYQDIKPLCDLPALLLTELCTCNPNRLLVPPGMCFSSNSHLVLWIWRNTYSCNTICNVRRLENKSTESQEGMSKLPFCLKG